MNADITSIAATKALKSRQHSQHNRDYWKALRLPCARCGGKIDYDSPVRLPGGGYNQRALVVGHIVTRVEALERGWSIAEINDLSNTQPECFECSWRSGGELREQRRRGMAGKRAPIGAPEASNW
jgi:hypothetical protein